MQKIFYSEIPPLASPVTSSHNFGFKDTVAFSIGIHGKFSSRNTPPVLNMKNQPYYFWDGRAISLEEQSLMPIQNPELELSIAKVIDPLNQHPKYRQLFQRVYKQPPTKKNAAAVLYYFE